MATKTHQMLVGLLKRKMEEKGFLVVAFEGKELLPEDFKMKIPFNIKRHRPDLIGYKFKNKDVCIGEAKTDSDIFTKRTQEQLLDYSSQRLKSTNNYPEVIIGIPRKTENKLLRLLKKLKLNENKRISYLCMPEELI